MGATLTSDLGNIIIDENVIAVVAGMAATDCYGIVGMSALTAGSMISGLLKGSSVSKGVHIEIEEEALNIDMGIVVEYGVSIIAVATNVMDNVKYLVESQCGVKVDRVNVIVKGIRVEAQ